MKKKNILVVSPHADDEILGCGGTLLKLKKQGYNLNWLLICDLKKKDKKKKIKSSQINIINKKLKFKYFLNLNLIPGSLENAFNENILYKIKIFLNKTKSEIVFLPNIDDIHTDHYYTARYLLSCLKWFRYKFVKKILMYETISETNLNFGLEKFNPNYYNDISDFIIMKINLMKIYKNEIGKHPFPRSSDSLKSLSILRGAESGYKYAEAFRLIYRR